MAAQPSPAPPTAPPRHGPDPARDPVGRPDLRVVERRRRRGRVLGGLVVVALVGAFSVVGLHAMAAQASFEAQTLEAEVSALGDRADELSARVAALESPDRIRSIAEDELGMVPAQDPRFVELDPGAEGTPERGQASRDGEAEAADARDG